MQPGTKLRWQPADRIEDIRGGGYPHVAGKRQDTVTIAGSLDYQACDDRICYNPVSVPLSWTPSLRPYARR